MILQLGAKMLIALTESAKEPSTIFSNVTDSKEILSYRCKITDDATE